MRVMSRFVRIVVAIALLVPSIPVPAAFAVTACTDVHIVWARGANRGVGDFDYRNFIQRDLTQSRILAPATVSDYQLGDAGFNGHKYLPADETDLILQKFGAGLSYEYSVWTGRDELTNYLTDRSAQCPGEVYVLGGYSEGADVMSSGQRPELPQPLRDRIAFVGLFGDPVGNLAYCSVAARARLCDALAS